MPDRPLDKLWFKQKALAAQAGRHGGKVVWKCIRDIQWGRRGLVPLKTANVVSEDGSTCSTPQTSTWKVEKALFKDS